MKTFSIEELTKNNGKNGLPVLIAYKGKVYDVTKSARWEDGNHENMHDAGKDLTIDLENAPHEPDVMERFPVIGTIGDETGSSKPGSEGPTPDIPTTSTPTTIISTSTPTPNAPKMEVKSVIYEKTTGNTFFFSEKMGDHIAQMLNAGWEIKSQSQEENKITIIFVKK